MKDSKSQARRWVRQAEYDLNEAARCLADDSFAYVCFFAEQCAQKALKGFLMSKGRRFVTIHAIGELLKEAAQIDNSIGDMAGPGQKLDRYYLSSRYPDALPDPAIPAESYTKEEAEEAVEIAKDILSAVQARIRPEADS